jgi:predicted MPP superfamily phosphohydrolase
VALDGLRIAVASDLHIGSPHVPLGRLPAIVDAVNATGADLILLGGDYLVARVLGGRFVPAETVVRGLTALKAPLGVYAVLGNHDRRRGRAAASLAAFAGGHPQLLENRAVRIARDGAGFWLIGLGDWKHGSPDVSGTLAQVSDEGPVIALTHNPDLFPQLPQRVALTVCGHTHIGQVRLPLIGAPYTASRHGQRYARGLIREGGKQLFVSAGIGTSWLPLRFRAPPEIVVLRITRG